jgi:hypothetical protein
MEGNSKKGSKISIAIVVLLVVAGIVFYAMRHGGGSTVSFPPSSKFVIDTPLFDETKILQNSTTHTTRETQDVRQFVASSTVPVVYKKYQDYFLKAGWDVTPDYQPKVPSQQLFSATKGGDRATVVVDSVAASGGETANQTVVTLSFFIKN